MKSATGAAPFPAGESAKTTSQLYTPPEVAYASRAGVQRVAVYEHSFAVRLTHWLNAIALFVMAGTGLRVYLAFPAFGDKLPPNEFFKFPARYSIGGWLGGALQWHFTFMWLFMGAGLLYVGYRVLSGTWRQVVFVPRDIRGVWPMFRHYFLFGPEPPQTESYNSLQKLAYTVTILLGVLSVITGLVLYKSAQFSLLIPLLGGYRFVRILHFLALVGFLAFIPGHLVMVLVHGWNNFQSMLTGWNFQPEYAGVFTQNVAMSEAKPSRHGPQTPEHAPDTEAETELGVPEPPRTHNEPNVAARRRVRPGRAPAQPSTPSPGPAPAEPDTISDSDAPPLPESEAEHES